MNLFGFGENANLELFGVNIGYRYQALKISAISRKRFDFWFIFRIGSWDGRSILEHCSYRQEFILYIQLINPSIVFNSVYYIIYPSIVFNSVYYIIYPSIVFNSVYYIINPSIVFNSVYYIINQSKDSF